MKHDELMPPRPGRRSWTRAEDYLPPRRLRRAASGQPLTARPARLGEEERAATRPLLGVIPFIVLMLGLGMLAVVIAVAAWPARHPGQPAATKTVAAASTEKMVTLTPPEHR